MLVSTRLDASDARLLVEAARGKATEIGVPMCIAVADESGSLVAFERMDGGKVHSIQVALDKAFTAASARRPTSELALAAQPGSPLFGINAAVGGRFSIVGGGVPVFVDGAVVGAVGVSSGTPEQDAACAGAAVDAFARRVSEA
ncbi:GlcG/HbpS family heme-binding protein [Sphingomonas corticis]|uniref:Heme-binding protein n=1 Tax=Sphingomonas corticis TaxID=2722791 RepID=A0ABX1CXA4_9SPHN|nr:heme-binding protein [Sphingomonas corticis]NJR80600.1 heme-binding protein [Sphingomonas corticis]